MTTLGKRIKKARLAATLSQQALADAICQFGNKRTISRTAIAQWELGITKEIEASNLLRASKVLNVTPEWLQFGIESTTQPSSLGDENTKDSIIPSFIPVLSCREAVEIMKKDKEKTWDRGIPHTSLDEELAKIAGPNIFALSVKNNSMAPLLEPGDIVIIDPNVKPHPGEVVIVKLLKEDTVVLRKYRPLTSDLNATENYELVAINKDWPKIIINADNPGHIIGTLIEHRCKRRINMKEYE